MVSFVQCFKGHFYRSALFIISSSGVRSMAGFLFWLIAAMLCSQEDVGIASAMIASLAIVVSVSRVGIDQSLTRYMPTSTKRGVVSAVMLVTTLLAVFCGIILIIVAPLFIPDLAVISDHWLLFLVFVVSSSLVSIELVAFISMRKSEYGLLQSIIGGTRIAFLFPLVSLGAIGIFGAELLSSALVASVSVYVLYRLGAGFASPDLRFIRDSAKYSIGNYVSNLTMLFPVQLMPLMVMAMLGPEETAVLYISFMISQILLVVPNSASLSLFVEGSHGVSLKQEVRKSVAFSYALLLPTVVLFVVFAEDVLRIVGGDYAQDGTSLLRLAVLSSLPFALTSTYFSVLKVRNEVMELAAVSTGLMSVLILTSYVFIASHGLTGVGYAWLISYTAFAVFCAIKLMSSHSLICEE